MIWCKMVLWLFCLFLWPFLIQFSSRIDANGPLGCPGSSYGRFLIQFLCRMVIWMLCLFLWSFLVQLALRTDAIWSLPKLLLWSFLVQSLLRVDAKWSSGCLGSSCGRFLSKSYWELMQYGALAALAPPVGVSYRNLIKNRCNMDLWLHWLSCGRLLFTS